MVFLLKSSLYSAEESSVTSIGFILIVLDTVLLYLLTFINVI